MTDNLEAIFPLSPTQQGMLFHSLYAPGDAVYHNQLHFRIDGPLDADRFRQAWQVIVDRHSALRTVFTWEKRDRPLQVVHKRARLAWHADDWSGLSPDEQHVRLRQFMREERARAFDIGKAPLFRVALLRLGAESFELACSHHHIILDGWSSVVLTREVMQAYQGAALPPAPPSFDKYVNWLQAQNADAAQAFWLDELSGVSQPSRLPLTHAAADAAVTGYGEAAIDLPAETAVALRSFIRQQRLTLSSVMQAAWGLVLSRAGADQSVVFGSTIAGRPADLVDVDRMVGCFINTLPVRVKVDDNQELLPWLRELMLRQMERERFGYCGLSDIQRWISLPPKTALFDSIVVVENHTPDAAADDVHGALRIGAMQPIERTNFPLTLVVDAGTEIRLKFLYHEPHYDTASARRLLDQLAAVIASIAGRASGRIADLALPARNDEAVRLMAAAQAATEVEALLRDHPAVLEAAVTARSDGSGGLIAFVVPDDPVPPVAVLRAFLQARLPEGKVPDTIDVVGRIPRTASGAVDAGASQQPEAERAGYAAEYVAPRNVEEELLAEIWGDVLGRERIGIHDDYFELGGDSIRGISIVARGKKIGLDLTLQHVFELRTIDAVTRARRKESGSVAEIGPVPPFAMIADADRSRIPAGVEDAYPLAALQAGMLYHGLMSPDASLYHNISSYRLKARFDEAALRRALAWLANRHPVLRTAFDLATYTTALQLVRAEVPVSLLVEDLTSLDDGAQRAAVDAMFEQEKQRPFEISKAPLWRFRAQKLSEDEFQLTLSEHHAILDGWSVASLVSEVLQQYYVQLGAPGVAMPPAPLMSYAEFIAEERRVLAAQESREFWRAQLADLAPAELKGAPDDYPPSNDPQPLVHADVTPEISSGLKRIARKAGVPLKTVLLAIHMRALQTLTGERRVATGLVSNGRLEATDGDRVFGLFLNSIPFVMSLPGGHWMDLFKAVFHHEASLLPHRRFPLAEIQRQHGGAAPFDTTFNFMHFHAYGDALALRGLDVLDARFFERANFALAAEFGLDPKSGHLRLSFDYDPARLTDSQVAGIAASYVQLMAAAVADPMQAYGDASVAPAAMRESMTRAANGPILLASTEDACERLQAHVLAAPHRTAVTCGAAQVTYGELNARINRLAHHLRSLGVGPDVRVGVGVDRSIDMVVALLAVMKAGGAYVPLDPSWPRERLRLILEDARPHVLISRQNERACLPEFGGQVVLLDRDRASLDAEPTTDPVSVGVPDNLAYVIYTSGSTGRPKGVAVTRACLTNFLRSMSVTPGLDSRDTLLAVTTVSFDIAGLELYLPLFNGASLIVATREQAVDGGALANLLDRHQVTVMQATPSTWRLLRATGWRGRRGLKMLCGGEALPRPLAAELLLCGAELWNVYGPTETTIWSTVHRVGAAAQAPGKSEQAVSIGGPIGNTQAYVVDCHVQPAPPGYRGDLLLGGDGVARGYLGRAALTAAAFVPDPFSGVAGARLYRTGDVVAGQRDGSLLFVGRRDHQIKLRGYRIELGEIEAVLASHAAVQEAAVVIHKGGDGHDRLVAYLVTERGAVAPTRDELRVHVEATLPEYMVPSAWVTLPALPLTPNGKINRLALPAPEDARLAPRAARSLPQDERERLVAQAWRESLQVEDLDLDDNFFDVGGHSLLLIRLHEKLKRQFAVGVQLVDLFRFPTIRSQARLFADTATLAASSAGATERADRQRAGFQKLSRLAATRRPS